MFQSDAQKELVTQKECQISTKRSFEKKIYSCLPGMSWMWT